MKRKHSTSLLMVANIKKRRTNQSTGLSDFFCKAEKLQIDSHDTLLYPVEQFTKTKSTKENLMKQKNKYAFQQEVVINLDAKQAVFNRCDCRFCKQTSLKIFRLNYQQQDQNQMSNKNRVFQQQTNSRSHFYQNMKQTGQFTGNIFKFHPEYFTNKQTNIFKIRPNLSIVNHNQSHVLNLKKNVDFYNQYVTCYDQKQTFDYFDQFSTFLQASDSMTSLTESFDSVTNNVMTSIKCNDSFMQSQQFQMGKNLSYCNYVY